MADEVRLGIAGLGVGRGRIRTAVETTGANLVCICDLQEDKVQEVAGESNCEWTTSFEDMIARDDIDAVGIFTPSGTHCDLALKSILAGKHTFTTKPMDINVDKCDAAIQAAKEAGLVLAVDFGNRYSRINHQVKAALDQGRLGKIFLGDVRLKWYRHQSYYDGGYPLGWRSRTDTEGGSIANQGVHYVDLIYWFLGPVKEVFGRSGTLGHEIETEDITIAHLTFQNGAWGLIETTTANAPNLGTTVEISGTEGTLVWKNADIVLCEDVNQEPIDLESIDVPPGPKNIIEDMVSAITQGTTPAVPGEEGKKSVEIFTSVYESSRTGQPVVLNQT